MKLTMKFKFHRNREMYVTSTPDDGGPVKHLAVRMRKWSWRHPLAIYTWERCEGSQGVRGGCLRWHTGLKKCGYLDRFN